MNFPLMLMSFCVGILIGLTSMGGAALMAPFLILVVGIKPVTAVGTDLVYGAVTKIVGAWVHYRQGSVDLPVVKRLAVGSIPGGLVGALAVILLPQITSNAEQYVKKTISGLPAGRRRHPRRPHDDSGSRGNAFRQTHEVPARKGRGHLGCCSRSYCVGATSVGSGSLLAPFLLLLFPSKTSKVIGTDVFHAAILVSVTGMAHAMSSGVEWNLVPTLLAGSIPGVLLGSRLAAHVPARPLRTGLAALLLLTGYRMF